MNDRPTIGIALSGGASRALAHVAVLEVLKKNNIPIDYLVGCSSGAIVAVAFASGQLDYFKDWLRSSSVSSVRKIWTYKNAKGGLFHLNNAKAEEELGHIVNGLTFQTANPKLGIVAADVNTGELVTISIGDMVTALKASLAVPGILEPIPWGEKLLVDGGLASIVPLRPLKDMGADIVIGVDISPAKFIYEKKLVYWKIYRFLTKWIIFWWLKPLNQSADFVSHLFSEYNTISDPTNEYLTSFQVLSKALDRSVEIAAKYKQGQDFCDLMISPNVKQYKKDGEFKNMDEIYHEGEKAALAAIPEIRRLMQKYRKSGLTPEHPLVVYND